MLESEKCSSKSSEIVRVDMSDTTSSDIEVLNQTRKSSLQSGHTRNSSDQSSLGGSSDMKDATLEEMMIKNRELREVLTARESKLMAVSREIVELQEESGEMSVRLQTAPEQIQAEKSRNQDLEPRSRVDQEQVTALKKEWIKLQQTRKTKNGDDQEKEEMINDLRAEGEALAKQNGKLSEAIRN